MKFLLIPITFLFCFLCFSPAKGQIDFQVNYQVVLDYAEFNNDYEDGEDDPAFVFGVKETNTAEEEFFLNISTGNTPSYPHQQKCYHWAQDAPTSRSDIGLELRWAEGTTKQTYDYHVASYEWDGGNGVTDRCIYDGSAGLGQVKGRGFTDNNNPGIPLERNWFLDNNS